MNRRIKMLALGLGIAAGASWVALAQLSPEDARRARHSILHAVALNFGPVAHGNQQKTRWDKEVIVTSSSHRERSGWMGRPGFPVAGDGKPSPGAGAELQSGTEDFRAN
jgi:hypothetical protein